MTTSSVAVLASMLSWGLSLATLKEMYFHCAVSGVMLSKNRAFWSDRYFLFNVDPPSAI
jgi:hypothetical protein